MKTGIVIAALVCAAFGAAAIRVVVEGRRALAEGDDWMLRGKTAEAIRAYEASARWYLPLAPHVETAYERLHGLANAEATALPAWRAIRSAARATRALWQPHAADLAAADEAIAKLSARDPAAGAGAGDTTGEREAWYRTHLAEDARPGIGAAALAALGILAWVGGAVVLARRGLDEAGRVVRQPAVAGGVAIVLGFACWVVGLYNA